jgi:hypothetical protein
MAGNTGYVSYANLELYYPDDNSAARDQSKCFLVQ